MPAPKALSGLPKPVLFGLYGALGGLLGALLFGEPLFRLLEPSKAASAKPVPQVAVAVSPEVPVPVSGANTFTVRIARAEFDGPVAVRFDDLPPGVTARPVTIPKGSTEIEAEVIADPTAVVGTQPFKIIAEANVDGKAVTASTTAPCIVSNPARPQADVFFVLDATSSMQREIDGVTNGIRSFAKDLSGKKIDFRIGLVAFRDLDVDRDAMNVLKFKDESFTTNVEVFRDRVGRLIADGGGDVPEHSLEAIEEAAKQPFRKSAAKVLLLITDAPPKLLQADQATAIRATADRLRAQGIDAVHLVCRSNELRIYRPLLELNGEKNKGQYFDLDAVARGSGFDRLLSTFGTAVVDVAKSKNPEGTLQVGGAAKEPELGLKSAQSNIEYAKGSGIRLAIASAVWTGAIAALVCLALSAGQHHYLRGTFPAAAGAIAGLLGGLAAGLVGGAAGQGLFLLAPENAIVGMILRVISWAILGGLAGMGLSLFIPNLQRKHGLAGGAIGGAVGAIGFIAASATAGELVGRLVGGLLLGLCIGLMVAIVEAAFRRAWLEVRYGERETVTVNLGPEPVKIGSDAKACTVWARGAVPLALRYFVRNGQIICEDAPTRTEAIVESGNVREVGNVRLTVRTGSANVPTTTPPQRPTQTPPKPQPAPKPASLDHDPLSLDDDDPLPVPISPPAVARPPAPPRPPTPASASPAPARTSPSPVQPTRTAGPRDPNACPGCGRVNPGRPGSRYCMLCDTTY